MVQCTLSMLSRPLRVVKLLVPTIRFWEDLKGEVISVEAASIHNTRVTGKPSPWRRRALLCGSRLVGPASFWKRIVATFPRFWQSQQGLLSSRFFHLHGIWKNMHGLL